MGKCRPISEEQQAAVEAELLRSNCPERNRALFVLGIETGLRVSELLSVTVGDAVDVAGRVRDVLIIKKENCKGKQLSRRIALSPVARDALFRAVNEAYTLGKSGRERHLFSPAYRLGPISRFQAYDLISDAIKAAGITHTRGTHTMRKTRALRVGLFAHRMVAEGKTNILPICAVRDALGHGDVKTTQLYLESGNEEVNEWTAKGLI